MYYLLMNTNKILWENVRSLMIQRYGKENLNKTNIDSTAKYKDQGISLGSLQRIKAQKTAIGTDVLEKIALFFDVDVWQLLVKNLNASNPPVLKSLSDKEQAFYEKMKQMMKELQ
jgi:hypothetical protein